MSLVACVDFGSTYTKAVLVDVADGRLVDVAAHPTSTDTDIINGWLACRAQLAERHPSARTADVLACSSAGGGLRIGVIGTEELVTAEAGRRVALSSGGRVVHVAWGSLAGSAIAALAADEPDIVLLTGGTDGGNGDVLLAAARALAAARWRTPVVLAGNTDVRVQVGAVLGAAGVPHLPTDNVLPRIGVLHPGPARAAVRAAFLRHVISGKHLSAGSTFARMVSGATPDVVLRGVELLAAGLGPDRPGVGDVVVVDVGGATTDVHSVVHVDPEVGGLGRDVVAADPVNRTVEADLGMRWGAPSTVDAGERAGLLTSDLAARLRPDARHRRRDPAWVPTTDDEWRTEQTLATAAVTLGLRRHAGRRQVRFGPDGRLIERTGVDLRAADLLVGSGGVLRHSDPAVAHEVLSATGASPAEWQVPRSARAALDADGVLAAAGLLANDHPRAAYALLGPLFDHGRTD